MAGNKNLAEDSYERLANAIILQTVADYRVTLKKIKAHPKNRQAIDEALEIERLRDFSVPVGTVSLQVWTANI